ncbi:hypothetical protein ACI8AC_10115 [Geodermatophilus sp. SYSU D00758]
MSFQRAPYPASGVLDRLPRSWGALPVARAGDGDLLVPVPAGELAWIGLLRDPAAPAERVSVITLLEPGGPTDALTGRPAGAVAPTRLLVPPARVVPGVARAGGGWWGLARVAAGPGVPACRAVELRAGDRVLVARFVSPEDFRGRTGTGVPPLDPDAPYGGRRLP